MISRITGQLVAIREETIEIEPFAGLRLELLVPTFLVTRLQDQLHQPVELFTMTYLESQNQGATMLPRLAGFASEADRAFFNLFVTTKGIGFRKALRAMAMPAGQIAAAIADRDTKTLQALPEIGRRTAETIVVTLKDKIDGFVAEAQYGEASRSTSTSGETSNDGEPSISAGPSGRMAREAMEVLLQLGESRADASMWIDKALAGDDPPTDTEALIAAVYALKAQG